MKKLIFTLALLSVPAFIFAQGVGVGIKAGANFSNYSTDNYSTSSVTKYHVGAYVNINFSEKWGITPEVLWSSQGAKIKNVGDFDTDFVIVPIMLRWNPIDLIFIEAGPQFNFLTKAEIDNTDVEDQMKSSTTCAAFGAGVKLPLGFNGGLRYVVGLSDLSDVDAVELKEGTFQIYIGWTILGSK
jgi:hypothetical protein